MNDKEIKFFLNGFTEAPKNYCWHWNRALNTPGYGVCQNNGRQVGAHRFSYEYFIGAIPHGMLVCHICDNPSCVNPDHLFLGTYSDNAKDMVNKGRNNVVRRFGKDNPNCKLLDEDVLYIRNHPRTYGMRKKLAEKFGVSVLTIKAIREGKRRAGVAELANEPHLKSSGVTLMRVQVPPSALDIKEI